ncbi:MAG: murein biosynthesis integral membrane protein MurJ [Proteobacteria bacterium]|nr:murein biosynthesis integral membrane protein MurJ [Pseudomonadota bacterium]
MSLLRAVATVGGFTMISRVTGFLRDVLIAAVLGASPLADAYFVAFKLPNFFRRLTAEGSFTVAFVPIFAGLLESDGKTIAMRFAEEAFAVMAAVLLTFTVGVILFMPEVMTVLAPGFVDTPKRFDLAVELTRVTFVYLPLISLVALMGGVLNSIGKFAAMASAPILLNLILISSLAVFADALDTPGHVLAWGVAAAGLAQFLWLLEACRRSGVLPSWRLPRWTPRMASLFRLMLPAMLGAAVVQINLLVDVILASTLPTGSVSFLYYADRLNQLPLGVVGVAIGTALLPSMSRQIRAGKDHEARASQNRALELGMLLTLPAAVGLIVLAGPIVEVLFQRGAFDSQATDQTALALAAYAAGLPAFVLIKIFQPGFFARRDTATPVKIAAFAVVLNLILNLILMRYYAHVGLAMATAIAAWVNMAALAMLLHRRGVYSIDQRALSRVARTIAAVLVMALGLFGAIDPLQAWLNGTSMQTAGALALLVLGGMAVYGIAAGLFGSIRFDEIRDALRRRVKRR